MRETSLTLVILAAGLSSRYGAPKALERLGPSGERLADYAIYDAMLAGFERVVYIVHPKHESTFVAQRSELPDRLEVYHAVQSQVDLKAHPRRNGKPWGTAHALLCAAPHVPGPFAMINADDFYGRSTFAHLAGHLRGELSGHQSGENADFSHQFAVVGYRLRQTLSPSGGVSRAICELDAQQRVTDVREHLRIQYKSECKTDWQPQNSSDSSLNESLDGLSDGLVGWCAVTGKPRFLSGDEWVSMNAWGFMPSVFPVLRRGYERFLSALGDDAQSEYLVGAAVQQAMREDKASVALLPSDEAWFGITFAAERELATQQLKQHVAAKHYPSPLF